MTTSKAVDISLTMRLVAIVITLMGFSLDENIAKCADSPRVLCDRFSPRNYFWSVVPETITILVTLGVISYVSKQIIRLQQSVAPVVNIQLPAIPTISHHISVKRKNLDDVRVEDFDDINDIRVDNDEESGDQNFQNDENNKEHQNDIHPEAENVGNDPSTSTQMKISPETKRINSDPNMFFKVQPPFVHEDNESVSCLPPMLLLTTAKKILVVNLESLLVMNLTIPRIIFHTYIYINGDLCDLSETVMLVGKLIGSAIDILFNIMILIVIHRKLDKFSS